MKRIALKLKQTLAALVLAGCTASAYAMTVSNMTSGTLPSTGQAITGMGSFSNYIVVFLNNADGQAVTGMGWFSNAASDPDDLDPDDPGLPTSSVLPPSDPTSVGGTSGSATAPVPEASDTAMMLAGIALLGGLLTKRGRRSGKRSA